MLDEAVLRIGCRKRLKTKFRNPWIYEPNIAKLSIFLVDGW